MKSIMVQTIRVMKKVLVLLSGFFAVLPAMCQTQLDTLFYDKNWKCISTKPFASYYRVMEKTADTTSSKPYRGYYFTGEMQADGYYISFDKDNDANSVFDGEYELFYKSGKTAEKGTWKNGKHEGEFTTFNEDGLIIKHLYYTDGELDGICSEFNEDGSTCIQTEYSNGKPRYDYYVLSNKDGQCSKVSFSDGKPIYESVSQSDMRVEEINDLPWVIYDKNGISVGLNLSDLGMQLSLYITNNSMFPIRVNEEDLKISFKNKKGEDKDLKVYSLSEYSMKLQRNNDVNIFFNTLTESLAVSNAGKSTSQTTTGYLGTTSTGKMYSGTTASVTTSYDATAAYQARIMASDRIAAYGEALDAERKIKESGYFKSTTINPGETIVGFVHAKPNNSFSVKAGLFTIELNINGVVYSNIWELWYDRQEKKLSPLTE